MKLRELLLLALTTPLLAFAGAAAAQVELAAGRFIAVTGDVRVLGSDGASRGAVRNGEFRQGESIVTGANSLAQLRMTDGGAVSVRSDSQLKLDNYSYAGPDDRNSSFFVSIVKGGFRTITGLIARSNRNNYRVSTSSATIGVRGTHFEVVHVLQPLKDAPAGTYNRVYDGITTFQNRTGATVLVNREQTAFIPLPSNLAPVLVPPPSGLFGKPTPVPPVAPQTGDAGAPAARGAAVAVPAVQEKAVAPSGTSERTLSAPLLNPIDSPRVFTAPATTLQQSPMLTPIDTGRSLTVPSSTLQVSPTLKSTIDLTPATSTISPVLTAPATSTISPVFTAPATSTISPVFTAPATSTISPVFTAPATSTISPVLSAPVQVTPIFTAPVTTTISPVMTAPVQVTPMITAPVTTTISPVFTAPATTIQQTAPVIKR